MLKPAVGSASTIIGLICCRGGSRLTGQEAGAPWDLAGGAAIVDKQM